MPPIRTSDSATCSHMSAVRRTNLLSRAPVTAATFPDLGRPLTRGLSMTLRSSSTSQRFSPYIPSLLSRSFVSPQTRYTPFPTIRALYQEFDTFDTDAYAYESESESEGGSNGFPSFDSSPAPPPPTSPEVGPNSLFSSPVSTPTPRQRYRTQPATPDTPVPASRRLRRTYAMRISPVRRSPTPMSVSTIIDSDGNESDGEESDEEESDEGADEAQVGTST